MATTRIASPRRLSVTAGRGAEQRNTIIEDSPQTSLRRAPPKRLERPKVRTPMNDDFPTPRANTTYVPVMREPESPASSDTQSDRSSVFSAGSSQTEFDDMYDMTESESDGDIPMKLSSSVKRRSRAPKTRYPSLSIPSPKEWPTADKPKSSATPLSPPMTISLSPSVLAQLQRQSRNVPSGSSTPSLDGSLTSEEQASLSCPSTPDIAQQSDDEHSWEAPVQLDPSSISLLQHINGEDADEAVETVLEVSEEAAEEMRQIVESPPITARMRLDVTNIARPDPIDAEAELSAISVPTPGGFFASLDSSLARNTWSGAEPTPTTGTATEFYGVPFSSRRESGLTTSTATSFYGVPWAERPENPVEHVVCIPSPRSDRAPITAKKGAFTPKETIVEVEEVEETYDAAIQESAAVNIDRTQLWLNAQDAYMKAVSEDDETSIVDSFSNVNDAVPETPAQASPLSTGSSPTKKSVRFGDIVAEAAKSQPEPVTKRISPIHDGTFWEGWRHRKRSQRARDVFQHRQARIEAEHVKRTSCQKQHMKQLNGDYEITATLRPSPSRPVSNFLPAEPEDEKKELIRRAERERQALEQMQTSSWQLSAQKELHGGSLITSPIVQSCKGRKDVRILDLAGQAHCHWAWEVAADHPNAEVYTTVSSDAEAHVLETSLEGPSNQFVVAAPKLWELPFENNFFDVISARNLYAHLKTLWPRGHAADEWDLTLRECLRCLKPGGYLEYDLLDAELVHPESKSQALGVEFAFNLKTRGYDPNSGKSFLPRLKRAGFQEIKRAWMVLPVADVVPRWTDSASQQTVERSVDYYEPPLTGSTADVRAMTGIVGARMWEQWMLKLNGEMGRSEERCLEGVAKALEEGGKGETGWRSLVGWARKGI